MTYDSRPDTLIHSQRVGELMVQRLRSLLAGTGIELEPWQAALLEMSFSRDRQTADRLVMGFRTSGITESAQRDPEEMTASSSELGEFRRHYLGFDGAGDDGQSEGVGAMRAEFEGGPDPGAMLARDPSSGMVTEYHYRHLGHGRYRMGLAQSLDHPGEGTPNSGGYQIVDETHHWTDRDWSGARDLVERPPGQPYIWPAVASTNTLLWADRSPDHPASSVDSSNPDTSQPYFLDLIARIDDATEDRGSTPKATTCAEPACAGGGRRTGRRGQSIASGHD